MSVTTWNYEAPAAPLVSSDGLKLMAMRLGFGFGLIMASGAIFMGILLTVLMGSSIIEF